jgi:thiosulfate/3-mercaptopyruvate sulfurtransferase
MSDYSHPEVLVSTQWVADHLHDPNLRIVESNEDILLYDMGHVPNAVKIDWVNDLNDQVIRDYLSPAAFAKLCAAKGIAPDTTVVFYGDKNNWWAAYAFWVFKLFGHQKCLLMNGGRKRWELDGRPLVKEKPTIKPAFYPVPVRDDKPIRVLRDEVLQHVKKLGRLVDVRSPKEFSGELTHMPEYPQEGVLRGGHIPGAISIPWAKAANEDGTFKSRAELEQLYLKDNGLKPDEYTVVYCRIGERSSHTWFVLNYLLGFGNVRNYDGSWTEWGNAVGMPIEKSLPIK